MTPDARAHWRSLAVQEALELQRRTGRPQQVLHIQQPHGHERFHVCAANDHRPKLQDGEYLIGFTYRTPTEG